MKNILVACIIFCLASGAFAQQRTPDGRVNFIGTGDRFQYINPFDERLKEVRGSRFFLDSIYRTGELKTKKQLYTSEMLYRFDQIERTVQVKLDNSKEMFINEYDVEYFKINFGERSVYFVNAPVPNGKKTTLVQAIYKSPTMQLLRDSRKYLFRVKSDNIDGYNSDEVYDEVRKDYRYFWNKGEGKPFIEVKPEMKSFIKAMPSKRATIIRLFKAAQAKDGVTLTKLSNIMKELDDKKEEDAK